MSTRKASTASRKSVPQAKEAFAVAEKAYGEAMVFFVAKRDWAKARDAFGAFLDKHGDERDLADLCDRARTHRAACEAKLAPAPAGPKTGDEWLVAAVVAANRGETDIALDAVRHAEHGGAPAGRVHYVRAAALALAGRADEALEALRVAIETDPENRAYSMGDPDFEQLRESAGYVQLVEPPLDDDDDDLLDDEEGFDVQPDPDGPSFPRGPAIY